MPSIVHPYQNLTGGQWVRGNLHTHTTRSDGRRPPQEVIDDYAGRGYDFLMISDHDIYTSAEDYRQWDTRGMVMIPGNEVTANGPHLLHVAADRQVHPSPQRQRVISDIHAGRGFAIVNHPNWEADFDHCSLAKMSEWIDYVGMEIYNGTIGRLNGSPYATNKWDMLLARGRRIWGFANDDSHLPAIDVGLGWNVAYVGRKTADDIVAALRQGRFYASTGVTISQISVHENRIRLQTENARRIVALHQTGCRFAVVDANRIEVEVPSKATYVRFECWGDGEQFAWTNPFFILP